MTRRRKIAVWAAVILIILFLFLWSPFSNYPVSLAVMRAYSGIHERDSIMAEKGIDLSVPGGTATAEADWYPFVMTFNDDAGFRRFTGDSSLKLTILYNFPAFDLIKGCSRLYDPTSPYYNGFYGAYLVCREPGSASSDGSADSAGSAEETVPYGFLESGELDLTATAQVPQFDFQNLVLRDFGIGQEQMTFDWELSAVYEDMDYAGISGWTRVDAALTVSGVLHEKKGFCQSYLQYGPPGYSVGGTMDFAPVEMVGRVYGRYFEEWDTSVFFYVLACDEEVLEACDQQILSQSVLQPDKAG